MKRAAQALGVVATLALPARAWAISHVRDADVVYENANVVTMDPRRPHATWVSVDTMQGRILGVGTSAYPTFAGPTTERVDLHGATVLPGFVDAHVHLADLGEALDSLDLSAAKDEADLVAKVAARAKGAAKGAWITGQGWNQNDWPGHQFPVRSALDRATPDNPVVLDRIDGHAVLVNAKALELAGVDAKTADPEGGRILRDGKGEPTGVLLDAAIALVSRKMPPSTPEQIEARLLRGQAWCHAHGITGVHDAGIDRATRDAYRRLEKAGTLKLRVYAMAFAGDKELLAEVLKTGPQVGDRFTMRAIKLVADGALGSRGASLLADYSDEPGNRGIVRADEKTLEKIATEAMRKKLQVCVHAIGDRANRDTLDALAAALRATKAKDARPRIEHAQVVSAEDLPRFAKLGVVASMQPWHVVGDKPWAEARVGSQRILGAYAWRTLLDSGAHLAGGSDAPAGGISAPLQGIHCAVTRQDDGGAPSEGWYPAQRMTRDEAVRAFTSWPAWSAFDEEHSGTIAGGNRADLVVLSGDPITVPPEKILEIRVERTIVGGEEVHEDSQAASARETHRVNPTGTP